MGMLRCIAWATAMTLGVVPGFASLVMVGPVNVGSTVTQTVLSIQNMGTVSGCVGFLAGGDVTGLAACPGAFTGAGGNESPSGVATATIGQLQSLAVHDASDLLVVFHSGEPDGTPLNLMDLALVFFDVAGGTSFTATLPGTPLALMPVGSAGANADIAFKLDAFKASLANDFMSGVNNRVGVDATLSGSTGAVDSFFLAAQSPTATVPEASVFWLAGIGLLMLPWLRSRT